MSFEIDLLTIEALTAMVKDFSTDPGLRFLNSGIFPTGTPDNQGIDTVTWDIENVERDIGNFEGLDSQATPKNLSVIGQQFATVIRDFKSKKIPGNMLLNLRNPGSEQKVQIAEQFITREALRLRQFIDRQSEWLIANALQGEIVTNTDGLPVTIDMLLPAAHKPTVAFSWEDKGTDIINDLKDWKTLTAEASGWELDRCAISPRISAALFKNDDINFTFAHTPAGQEKLVEGSIGRLWGIDFFEYNVTSKSGATVTRHIDEKKAVFYSSTPGWNKWIEAPEVVPSGDDSMVEQSGIFAYSEVLTNPTRVVIYAGFKRLPVITVPTSLVVAQVIP